MALVQDVEDWVLSICIKKGIADGVKMLAAYVGAHAVGALLPQWGIALDWNAISVAAVTGGTMLFGMIHDYLKVKKGWTFL